MVGSYNASKVYNIPLRYAGLLYGSDVPYDHLYHNNVQIGNVKTSEVFLYYDTNSSVRVGYSTSDFDPLITYPYTIFSSENAITGFSVKELTATTIPAMRRRLKASAYITERDLLNSYINVKFTIINAVTRAETECIGLGFHTATGRIELFAVKAGSAYNDLLGRGLVVLGSMAYDSELMTFANNTILKFDYIQPVPDIYSTLITTISDSVGNLTYKILDNDGNALATLYDAPPMRSAKLSTVENMATMKLTGLDNKSYLLQWTFTPPANERFIGLSSSPDVKIVEIPNDQETAINWNSDVSMYGVYAKFTPITKTFDINLYQNSAEQNRVDKTSYLTSVGTLSGVLRDECSIITPSIIIAQNTLPVFNYVYIPVFNRYYFVTGITSVKCGLWRIEMTCDVLMSYRTGIKALNAVIARQENDYNDYLNDNEVIIQNDPIVEYVEIPSKCFYPDQEVSGTNYAPANVVITVIQNK